MEDPCRDCGHIEERNKWLPAVQSGVGEPSRDGQRYEFLFRRAPDAIFVADAESGIILDANQSAADLLDMPAEDIIGTHQSQLHPAEEAERYKRIFDRHAEQGYGIVTEDLCICRNDGHRVPVQINAMVTEYDGQKIIFGIFRDMTSEYQQQQILRAILETSQDCILVWDRDCNYLYANQAACDYITPSVDNVIGKNIRDTLAHTPDFMDLWVSRIEKTFKTGKTEGFEDALIVNDQLRHSESYMSPLYYFKGEMFAVSLVYRDITERKQLEEKIKASEEKYRRLYEDAHVALFCIKPDGKPVHCNKKCLKMFGFSPEEKEDFNYDDMNLAERFVDSACVKSFFQTLTEKKKLRNFEAELKRANGSTFWASFSADSFPESGYIEGAIYDITIKKELTNAERRILKHLLDGETNKQIAGKLGRSVRTVEDHRSRIMRKLDVENAFELTRKVIEAGEHL